MKFEQIHQNLHRLEQPEAFLPYNNPTLGNPAWDDADLRVLIVRLSPWRDVDRSTPHLFLFQEVRRAVPKAWVDLAFFPPSAERAWMGREGIPYLIGTQSLHAAADFDLLLISNAYTLELINLPYLLLHSDIPLWASERGPEHPLLILGGSNALAAQAILRPNGDALVDAIFFGEGEGAVGELARALADLPRLVRKDRLPQMTTRITGLWVAGANKPVQKAILHPPHTDRLLTDAPILNTPAVREASLQISYGCPAFCAFCFEGYERKPYRELPIPALIEAARRVKRAQGAEDLNLYSFNVNTYTGLLPLLVELERRFERVSLKSQRVDLLQHTEGLLEAEFIIDKRSFTLGIEGISERLRARLHKSLPTADMDMLLSRLFAENAREVKLFYLLTGDETETDIAEFRQWIRAIKGKVRGTRVVFSFGLLIRMPFTPLRYDRLRLDEAEWKPIIGQVKSACETNGFEFRMAFDWPAYCVSQVLALGDTWLSDIVIALARRGYCFETRLPADYWPEFQAGVARAGHWNDEFLGYKPPDYVFPLAFVQTGIADAFLYRQFQAVLADRDEGYCLGNEEGEGHCLGCQACTEAAQRETITRQRAQNPQNRDDLRQLKQIVIEKRHIKPIYLRVRLPPFVAHTEPEFRDALVFKALLDMVPAWTDNLLSVRESLFSVRPNAEAFPVMYGETILALRAWKPSEIADAVQKEWLASDLIEVVGIETAFTPGTFDQLDLDVRLPTTHFVQPRQQLEACLREEHLPYTLRREGAGYRFEIPPQGRKKKVLFEGCFEVDEQTFHARLTVGPRFNLLTWLESFGRGYSRYADVCVTRVITG